MRSMSTLESIVTATGRLESYRMAIIKQGPSGLRQGICSRARQTAQQLGVTLCMKIIRLDHDLAVREILDRLE